VAGGEGEERNLGDEIVEKLNGAHWNLRSVAARGRGRRLAQLKRSAALHDAEG